MYECSGILNQEEHLNAQREKTANKLHPGEKEALSFTVFPVGGVEPANLESAIRSVTVPRWRLTWAPKFVKEDVSKVILLSCCGQCASVSPLAVLLSGRIL